MEENFVRSIVSAGVGVVSSATSYASVVEVVSICGGVISIISGGLACYYCLLGIKIRKTAIKREAEE